MKIFQLIALIIPSRSAVRLGVLLCLAGLPLQQAGAQSQGQVYVEDGFMQVIVNGTPQRLAWSGGMNNPQFATADLDHDGKQDLVVFERYNGKVKTFLNKGVPGQPLWVYRPEYAANFPAVSEYLVMLDYNRDGITDLFHMGEGLDRVGFAAYKGYYDTNNRLAFTFYKSMWYSNDLGTTPPVNAYVNPSDIPAIADIDGDGDIDFLAYGNWGTQLKWYQNMQVENNLHPDSIIIRLADHCWGKVDHGGDIVRAHRLQQWCDNSKLMKPAAGTGSNKTNHSGNTLCLFDADGDGDMDYLDGNVSFNDMVFLENGKAQYGGVDSMIYQDTTWPSRGTRINVPQWPAVFGGDGSALHDLWFLTQRKIDLPQWPAAFWVDADGDGLKDLLVSPHAENTSENYKCAWYYRNTGTAQAPAYTYQKDTFLIEQMIDVGTAAYPILYDYNKDGKPDLFVGSDGYYRPDGTFRSQLSYYENTSTGGSPSFTLITKDMLQLSGLNIRGSAPAFGDLDNDGKDDLVLGHTDGTLTFFRNTAASNSVTPVWQRVGKLQEQGMGEINVWGYAMPFIYDLNRDGKKDLIIGYQDGRLFYYQNTGTQGVMRLTKVTDTLGGVRVNDFYGKSAPFIGRMDNTGKDYLVIGSDVGNIYRFTGFQDGNIAIPYTRIDSNYSFIDAGLHTALTIGDIDGDGKYEMIVGNEFGGLNLYKQALLVNPVDAEGPEAHRRGGGLQLYPNPASDRLLAGLNGEPIAEHTELQIFNSMGQLVRTARKLAHAPNIEADISGLPPGVYFCRMQHGDLALSGSFIKR
jgi:hypothetical protein